ncbi:hypothetical protein [Ketogulonicigenium vulgare]|uniref:hypothetical protein n=2 Tax=Ketogulonicigenium vulgare TaxID=92945 RepID=UPI0001E6760D|nr:hypothetical protein [Ketogulonicigenium vulgare]ADO41978.1 conserved hypothetical protein [Ketogulonicigenium vulgare Y25]ALJ80404.1 hypothetical protein KVH_03950 [Ketogulonicigenium vulgare]ANW33234.1 hypothetical protein KvSKV_03920 [Ketogulonicigenium vulgare]AOZ53903.1 hypothetical protein KVC_0886 [Ketogulonicigenium vulgare]
MTVELALALTFDGIRLLRLRDSAPGEQLDAAWERLGEAALDAPDLAQHLVGLRDQGASLLDLGADAPVPVQIVLPPEQLRYMALAGHLSDSDALAKLEGATPYPLDDLCTDLARDETKVYLAAVAAETLSEAEDFARQHGFQPLFHTSLPAADVFPRAARFSVVNEVPAADAAEETADVTTVIDAPAAPPVVVAAPAVTVDGPVETPVATDDMPAPRPSPSLAAPLAARRNLPEPLPETEDEAPKPVTTEQMLDNATQLANRLTSFFGARGADLANVAAKLPKREKKQAPALPPLVPKAAAPKAEGFIAAKPIVARPSPTKPVTAKVNQFERMPPRRAAPRYLWIILAAALLLVMLVIALLTPAGRMVGALFAPGPAAVATTAPDALPDTDAQDAAAAAVALALQNGAASAGTQALIAPLGNGPVTQDEAESFHDSTGVWIRSPRLAADPRLGETDLGAATQDQALAALQDGQAPLNDPAEMTEAALIGDTPAAQPAPPAAGTRLPRDARGFVAATPEGTQMPDGMMIYAGRPATVPPNRPDDLVPAEALIAPDATLDATAESEAALAPEVDATAAGIAATALAALTEDAAPAAAPAPAVMRPALRPTAIEEAAALALNAPVVPMPLQRPQAIVAAAAAAAAVAVAEPVPAASTNGDVVAALSSIMQNAPDPVAAAQQQAAAEAQRQAAAQAAAAAAAANPANAPTREEAAEEDEVVVPGSPTGAVPQSVAQSATIAGAMNLREMNLIGVVGRQNDRRALVRLSNGRVEVVRVGDALDGGQVTAIGDNVINYVKRGRTYALQIAGAT